MAPRSSWKGFLKLSLVSVPVKAYTANNTSSEIHLNQLHSGCHNRIRYRKVCPEHGEVQTDQIVSGYEFAKNQYVVINLDELDKLRTKNDHSVSIEGFVKADTLDTVYYSGKTYYLVPDGAVGQKPYSLLLQGMKEAGVHAVAHVVVSQREQLILLRPYKNILLMTILAHHNAIKSADSFKDEISETELAKEELDLTKTLIKASMIKKFNLASYKNNYVEKLTQLIQLKVEGKEIVQAADAEEPKIINLMEALKKSVAEAQSTGAGRPKAPSQAKKMAPSARSTGTKKRTTKKKIV
jgi:DNA end-binding protein Ku